MTMQAVGRAANRMMLECRNQFDKMRAYLRDQGHDEAFVNNSDNWPRTQIEHQGRKVPDYTTCVAISTKGAQREMIAPSLLALALVGVCGGVPVAIDGAGNEAGVVEVVLCAVFHRPRVGAIRIAPQVGMLTRGAGEGAVGLVEITYDDRAERDRDSTLALDLHCPRLLQRAVAIPE